MSFSDLGIVGRNVLKIYELKERTQFLPGPAEHGLPPGLRDLHHHDRRDGICGAQWHFL